MRSSIKIGNHIIGEGKPVFIIAEAGVNHNGSLKLAKKLVDRAKSAGADAIKFQTFKAEELATKNSPQADYQKKNSRAASQYEMLKKLELSENEFKELNAYCKRKKILFLSTPFDQKSAAFLDRLGVPAFKISSGDLTNTTLLSQIANYGKPIILSTGMSDMAEVKEAVKVICRTGNKQLILLHCTSNYPTRYEDVNLRAMNTLRKSFEVPIGYSDHTEGIEISIAASAMGANVIEKHFTMDKNFVGPDHKASLELHELALMVRSIRNIEKAMGDGIKEPKSSEANVKKVARKSVVAAVDIPKGKKILADMLTIKRPGTGIAPKYIYRLIGRKAKRNIARDSVLIKGML